MGSQPRGISASRGAGIITNAEGDSLSEFTTRFETWQLIMEERFPPRPLPDGSVIMGHNDHTALGYPGFNAARGYTLPERKESAPLRWGTAFEDSVVELAEWATGQRIFMREELFALDLRGDRCMDGQITCHIDGMYTPFNPEQPDRLHEGKTTSLFPFREKWGEPGTSRVPRTYQMQVQHQMACTGAELDIVSVLVFPETPDAWEKMGWRTNKMPDDAPDFIRYLLKNEDGRMSRPQFWANVLAEMGYFHQYPVPADRTAQKLLLDGYRHFWDHYVLTGIEPELRTYDDIKRAFPEPKGTIVCDADLSRWWQEYKDISVEIGTGSTPKKRQERLRKVILLRARAMEGFEDDESEKTMIFRDETGRKLGQYSKSKAGTYVFMPSRSKE